MQHILIIILHTFDICKYNVVCQCLLSLHQLCRGTVPFVFFKWKIMIEARNRSISVWHQTKWDPQVFLIISSVTLLSTYCCLHLIKIVGLLQTHLILWQVIDKNGLKNTLMRSHRQICEIQWRYIYIDNYIENWGSIWFTVNINSAISCIVRIYLAEVCWPFLEVLRP